jgi:hypothetical protein
MAMFAGMASVEDVTLRGNGGITDAGIVQLQHAAKLRKLWLQKLSIRGTGFAEWPADHGIETIFIEGIAISNDGLAALARLRKLKLLAVRVIQLFGGAIEVDVSCFIDSPSLESVALEGSYVATPASLDKLMEARPKFDIAVNRAE